MIPLSPYPFNRSGVLKAMSRVKVSSFTQADVEYLKEYAEVMAPVASALDKLQGEAQAYLGCLLPTLAVTMKRLEASIAATQKLAYCEPLVEALLAGTRKRFSKLMEDKECQLAAAFHPKFRLMWLEKFDQSLVKSVKTAMEKEVEKALQEKNQPVAAGSDTSFEGDGDREEDDFYAEFTQHSAKETRASASFKTKAVSLVNTWIATGSKGDFGDGAFMGEPVFKELFVKFNTPVPSSAAVERIFSIGKDILRAKRASLSDENFDILMFMRGNMHLVDKYM